MRNEFLELFHTDIPLSTIAKKYKIDERKIREMWIEKYGKEAVRNRKIVSVNSIKNKGKLLKKLYTFVEKGYSIPKICSIVNIKSSTAYKYICLDSNIRKKLIKNGKMARKNKISPHALSSKIKKDVMEYFHTDLTPLEVSKIIGISANSVRNIFKTHKDYNERVKRMKKKGIKRTMVSLERAGKLGSQPERKFFDLIRKHIILKVIHHDFSVLPPYEIDITIPDIKVAICWDGIGHYKPIFGKAVFNKVKNSDRIKRRAFKRMGWKVFIIKDLENSVSDVFLNKQLNRFFRFMKKLNMEEHICEQSIC